MALIISEDGNLHLGDDGFRNCWELFTYQIQAESPTTLPELLTLMSRCEREFPAMAAHLVLEDVRRGGGRSIYSTSG